ELRRALSQLTRTIAWLHEQDILHRDLKPSNILYTPERKVVVLDFGLAAQLRDMNATMPRDDSVNALESARSRFQGPRFQSTTVAGTALYMSPEQAAGKELGNASDWYSLGVIIYQLLTGQRPFEGRAADVMLRKQADDPPAPHELNPLVPIDLSELCIALLNRDPERRPQADEILHLLNEAKSDASQPIKQPIEPFVGRGREISTLARSYRDSANQLTVAVVHGESGVGKSTLVDRFLRNLSENARPLILRGRCFEQESVPFKAVDNLIDELARWLTHQSESELNDLLPEDFALLTRVFPVLLRARASESLEHTETSIPDARELRRLAVRALRELLTRIARRHRLVLAIDDLQWGDVDSSLLLNELFGTVDAPRLLLILSFRSEYVRTSQCLTTLALIQSATPTFARIEVHVGPLSVEETRKLAKHILGTDHPRADDCSRQIAREADGSPYFAFELARYYKDSSRVIPDSVATQGKPISHKTEVNTSTGTEHLAGVPLEEVLWQRFLALEAPERDLIALLAVAGRPVTLGQAGNAAGLHDSLQIVWASLRSQHLIKGFGPRLDGYIETFHDRIRETIVARLSNEQRRMCHAQLAHTLVHDDESDPETIAVHFEGCGEYIRAGEYFAKAAEAAAESLAFSRAVELYQRSLDLRPLEGEPRRRLRLAAADALANAGMGAQAAEVYQEVARGAKNVEEATGWEQAAATQYCISGHIDRGRELFRRVLRRRGIRLFTKPWQALASWLWWR
ncbi:MAG: AAA family ATPase, partial [Planctomycetales bacterium]|nr:AAA family ATPase [Planctomycetales bacterium]